MNSHYRYLAILDDHHDTKDPRTLVRILADAGPTGVSELNDDTVWVETTLLHRIDAGEVAYRAVEITAKAAARIRERREKKITYRYSILVYGDDPMDEPTGVLREWDASSRSQVYGETYTPDGEWELSAVRKDIARGSDIATRIVPSDAATVHRFISRRSGW